MSTFQSEFAGIAGAFAVALVGAASIIVSLFRRTGGDRSLSSFGALSLIYGLRWLIETETMRSVLGFPFDLPYVHAVLTYVLPIPLAAFLLQIFGPGLWQSMRLVFWSSVVNAIVLVAVDVATGATFSDASISIALVIAWCLVGIVNLAFPQKREATDLLVVRGGLLILFLAISHDNLMSIHLLPWSVNLSNGGFLLLCLGLGFVAVRHFVSNERDLLAVEQELSIARRIQQSNLPTDLTAPEALSLAARYLPMTAIAGDFYDIHVIDGRGTGILIADVSGHGVGAALIGSMLKIAFAAQADHVDDPARVLGELNRILHGKVGDGFVTACAVFLDTKRQRLRYANAGHPAPILRRRSKGTPSVLTGGGTILGPFAGLTFKNAEKPVASGDRLVLFTDGLVETRNRSGEFFGDERLLELVGQENPATAKSAATAIIDGVLSWSGKRPGDPLDDDMTLVVVDVLQAKERNTKAHNEMT
ncbi:MAG: serine/threonine-protein phosphatase [Bacteroidetes bacterium]|jgi:sigma-B regulation protein RsbU (phosphoserine phosphatase)|nr:serine/threonine-protein phosphatase [Bacteroidota bacterium]